MTCGQCEGIEQEFNEADARKTLKRFRRRGPDPTTQLLIDGVREALNNTRPPGVTLLDVGAGIGAIHHELLTKGVDHAVHVDASSAHLAVAREETVRRGHSASVEFVLGDFVDLANLIAPADVVTLDRVICCYPDMPRLVRLSAEHTRRLFGAVYPRGNFWMRTGLVVINLIMRIKRSPFRVFHHDPVEIDAVLRSTGLQRRRIQRRLGWEVVVYERP
jgi:hypothetical protein